MEKKLGIYVHIPFCAHKCAYCDFFSVCDDSLHTIYFKKLFNQIFLYSKYYKNRVIDSIFIGGGTPTLPDSKYIVHLISFIRKFYNISKDCEITIEANPATFDRDKLNMIKEAGVNRLSIGLQSANDTELAKLSRIHSLNDFEKSYYLARECGFDNINIDLMYALPDQTEEDLAYTLRKVLRYSPEHISFYGLKIEKGTPFFDNAYKLNIPNEDTQVQMYKNTCKLLEQNGYIHYEISNFALKGRECRHNLKYWNCDEYLGFGSAAHSFVGKKRYSFKKKYIRFLSDR